MGRSRECIERANNLISACKLQFPIVNSVSQLNSQFFISLFNALCTVPLLDLKELKTIVDEIHNIQMVIDTLSLDVLNISLSHITGEDIAAGNVTSIGNLLEIFEAYLHHSPKLPEVKPTDEQPTETEAHATDSDGNLLCNFCGLGRYLLFSRKKPCPVCKGDSTRIRKTQASGTSKVFEVPKDKSRDQLFKDFTSTSFKPFDNIEKVPSEFIESTRSKSEDFSRINMPEKSVVDIKKSHSEQNISRVSQKPVVEASHDQLIKRSLQHIQTSPSEESYKDITKSSLSEQDLRHVSKKLPPRTSHEVFIDGSVQRIHTSLSLSEESYKDMPELSNWPHVFSSSPKSSISHTKHLSDYVQEPSTSRADMRSQRMDDVDEQMIPKRKFSPLSSSPEESIIEDPIIQISDSLLLKKQRTEEDTIAAHDLLGLYRQNMAKKIRLLMEYVVRDKIKAKAIERTYKEALSPKYLRKKSLRSCKKSFLLPMDLRRIRRTPYRTPKRRRKKIAEPGTHIPLNQRSLSSGHTANEENGKNQALIREGGKSDYDELAFFRNIRETFPGIHIPENTMRNMKDRYFQHLAVLHKNIQDELLKKTPVQVQLEEALRKQKVIADLIQKDIEHACRLNDVKEYRDLAQKYKSKIRDDKLESAKVHQYYEKYYKDFQKKMRNATDNDEMMVGGLLEEKLNKERDDVRQLLNDLKEKQDQEAQHNKVYLEALANLYQTEFNLLADTLADENRNAVLRAKDQEKFLRDKKRTLKQKMKDEIEDMQENILRNQRDTHFREMDIQRYREDNVKRRL